MNPVECRSRQALIIALAVVGFIQDRIFNYRFFANGWKGRRDRDYGGVEGGWGGASPYSADWTEDWGVEKLPSGVQGRATTENEFDSVFHITR